MSAAARSTSGLISAARSSVSRDDGPVTLSAPMSRWPAPTMGAESEAVCGFVAPEL